MKYFVLALVGLVICSNASFAAATKYSVRKCYDEEVKDLDASAMDFIKANNFSDGTVYTAVPITPEADKYSGQAGVIGLTITDKGLFLSSVEFCASTAEEDAETMPHNRFTVTDVSLSDLLKNQKEVLFGLDEDSLSSDEHIATEASEVTLKVIGSEDGIATIQAKVKLRVADSTGKKPVLTESLDGTFYFHVGSAKLAKAK